MSNYSPRVNSWRFRLLLATLAMTSLSACQGESGSSLADSVEMLGAFDPTALHASFKSMMAGTSGHAQKALEQWGKTSLSDMVGATNQNGSARALIELGGERILLDFGRIKQDFAQRGDAYGGSIQSLRAAARINLKQITLDDIRAGAKSLGTFSESSDAELYRLGPTQFFKMFRQQLMLVEVLGAVAQYQKLNPSNSLMLQGPLLPAEMAACAEYCAAAGRALWTGGKWVVSRATSFLYGSEAAEASWAQRAGQAAYKAGEKVVEGGTKVAKAWCGQSVVENGLVKCVGATVAGYEAIQAVKNYAKDRSGRGATPAAPSADPGQHQPESDNIGGYPAG